MIAINRAAVEALFPMEEAIVVMRGALAGFARGSAFLPQRTLVFPPDLAGTGIIKPAALSEPKAFGMKILTEFLGNRERGLEVFQGAIILFDPESGTPSALVEASSITSIRTAAVSAVATDVLARENSSTLAILGAGVQARSHLRAMLLVRPFREIRIWNRTPARARELADWAEATFGVATRIAARAQDSVDGADVVCTVTAAADPVVDRVDAGAHVNAVGAYRPTYRELSTSVVVGATIVVDSRDAALREAGDLLIPVDEGAMDRGRIAGAAELGEVITGDVLGRHSAGEVTLFKSLGLAFEDIAAAAFVVDRARHAGAGTDVDFP